MGVLERIMAVEELTQNGRATINGHRHNLQRTGRSLSAVEHVGQGDLQECPCGGL